MRTEDNIRYGFSNFTIDEIYEDIEGIYHARVIPNLKSDFFAPHLLRTINLKASLLKKDYYQYCTYGRDVNENMRFKGSIIQGGYYEVPKSVAYTEKIFNASKVFDEGNDIFGEFRRESPFSTEEWERNLISISEKENNLSDMSGDKLGKVFLYCFNVGQGDSLLLITNNGSVYMIDLNYYSEKKIKEYIKSIKRILASHNLDARRIKSLVITHKHIDHYRGITSLLDEEEFDIERILINADYEHSTISVKKMIEKFEEKNILTVNVNRPGQIIEGDTRICLVNPDETTSDNKKTKDINDSSICICVEFQQSFLFLTGDASSRIISEKFSNNHSSSSIFRCLFPPFCGRIRKYMTSMLKVSHHGSRTGTNANILNSLSPNFAFISAGTSKKFNHPHRSTIEDLKNNNTDITISKNIKHDILFELNGAKITKKII